MATPCHVGTCLALATNGKTCAQHHEAMQASGAILQTKCATCNRTLKKGDWIVREPKSWKNRRKELKFAYRHVACERLCLATRFSSDLS